MEHEFPRNTSHTLHFPRATNSTHKTLSPRIKLDLKKHCMYLIYISTRNSWSEKLSFSDSTNITLIIVLCICGEGTTTFGESVNLGFEGDYCLFSPRHIYCGCSWRSAVCWHNIAAIVLRPRAPTTTEVGNQTPILNVSPFVMNSARWDIEPSAADATDRLGAVRDLCLYILVVGILEYTF
jgi:hypothetical protein